MDNSNILPSATNATQSIESGSLGDVIEFMTWNDLVLQQGIRSADTDYASRIRNNIVDADDTIHSSSLPSYMSLYIPLTQSFNISDIQSFVLYNRPSTTQVRERINGFQIELYNRSNGFTPGTNVLYSMPINTTANVYRFDLPAITSYTGGFSTPDSQTQIKDITVSASTRILEASTTLLKVEGTLQVNRIKGNSYEGNISIVFNSADNLHFFNNTTNSSVGYIEDDANVGQIDFTGQHRCFIKDLPFSILIV